MDGSLHRTLAGSLVLISLVAPATAQIDRRVNQGNAGTAGYARDRNPMVGSGGYNYTRPGFDAGYGANAIVTGNVTGLAAFKGFSPVLQTNQFREALPSSGLADFQARSIGASEVPGLRPGQPSYYYDPTRTIADLGLIRQGLNLPGSSRPISPYLNFAPAGNMTSNMRLPRIPGVTERRAGFAPAWLTPGVTQRPVAPDLSAERSLSRANYLSAVGSEIFGANLTPPSPPPPPALLDGEPVDLPIDAGGPGLGAIEAPTAPEDAAAAPNLIRRGEPSTGQPGTPAEKDADGRNTPELGVRQREVTPPAPSESSDAGEVGSLPSNLGDDRFADLYTAVKAARETGVTRLGFDVGGPSAAPADRADGTAPISPAPPMTALRRESDEDLARLASVARWASSTLEEPIRTFVGRHQNRVNELLASAEQSLRVGKYYQAADRYELAHAIDPLNPLPLLGRGHALAAAGDYISAVRSLELGISRFPQIALFRLDLPELIGHKDVFDVRRADLERQLSLVDHYELRFLLGYLELYSGLVPSGLRNLDQAARAAPPDRVIARFPALLRSEVPPAPSAAPP